MNSESRKDVTVAIIHLRKAIKSLGQSSDSKRVFACVMDLEAMTARPEFDYGPPKPSTLSYRDGHYNSRQRERCLSAKPL